MDYNRSITFVGGFYNFFLHLFLISVDCWLLVVLVGSLLVIYYLYGLLFLFVPFPAHRTEQSWVDHVLYQYLRNNDFLIELRSYSTRCMEFYLFVYSCYNNNNNNNSSNNNKNNKNISFIVKRNIIMPSTRFLSVLLLLLLLLLFCCWCHFVRNARNNFWWFLGFCCGFCFSFISFNIFKKYSLW